MTFVLRIVFSSYDFYDSMGQFTSLNTSWRCCCVMKWNETKKKGFSVVWTLPLRCIIRRIKYQSSYTCIRSIRDVCKINVNMKEKFFEFQKTNNISIILGFYCQPTENFTWERYKTTSDCLFIFLFFLS